MEDFVRNIIRKITFLIYSFILNYNYFFHSSINLSFSLRKASLMHCIVSFQIANTKWIELSLSKIFYVTFDIFKYFTFFSLFRYWCVDVWVSYFWSIRNNQEWLFHFSLALWFIRADWEPTDLSILLELSATNLGICDAPLTFPSS